jgi:predicted dehydrogenase/threonine dehydrogenase-like Zn-dependent dehydrogenase
MRQILCNLQTGKTLLAEVPAPGAEPGQLLIRTTRTLVSQGTEKMLVEFGKASLFQKARSQPQRVRQVWEKMKVDGIRPTLEAVFRRLDEPLPLGYCSAGVVIGVGEGVSGFAVGDRVASNGPHAEIVAVPANLCARIPATVSDDEAAFTVAGAIALQGIRLGAPALGETVAVVGLGLLGQLAVQLLRANGCQVLGYDYDPAKVELARRHGAEALCVAAEGNPVKHALAATGGQGVDFVLITASTKSNEVIAQCAQMSRKRGRIVLVGVIGLEINRADFYDKELSFQVSCSYGPGRYESAYEEKGLDYPAAFVRWTENRNFQAILETLRAGHLRLNELITKRVPLDRYEEIYADMGASGLASLLVFGDSPSPARQLAVTPSGSYAGGIGALAVVGTGNFTKMTVLPALRGSGAKIKYLASARGVTSTDLAGKHGIPYSTTDYEAILADPEVAGVILCTRHHLHAAQVTAALQAGKHVLVEKPLCLTRAELSLVAAASVGAATVTVGFNRRFSPHVRRIAPLLVGRAAPVAIVATINASAIPLNHWVQDPGVGGGRLIGEACHFVDLAVHLSGSLICGVCAVALGERGAPAGDSASILLRHADGSTSSINYLANGHRSHPKERIEIYSQERIFVIDDFRETTGVGYRGFSRLKTAQDKGHAAQFAEFARRVREGGPALIPRGELLNVAAATLAIGESIRAQGWVNLSIDS